MLMKMAPDSEMNSDLEGREIQERNLAQRVEILVLLSETNFLGCQGFKLTFYSTWVVKNIGCESDS